MLLTKINPLNHPLCLALPARITTFSAWHEHTPFAMWLIAVLRPQLLVELGTHYGDSYCAFCQAVSQLKLETKCFAIDTWAGDPHAGGYGGEVLAELRAYHDPLYGSFSRLLPSTFADARAHFADASIDLLHIDGYHTYEAVKEDFTTWLPKMRSGGVVLFHDTNVRERDFGVWRLWEELKLEYSHFEFRHGHGLGVLVVGQAGAPELQMLCAANTNKATLVGELFFALGQRVSLKAAGLDKEQTLNAATEDGRQQARIAHDQAVQLEMQEQKRARLSEPMEELAQARQTIEQLHARLAQQEQVVQQLTRQAWEHEQNLHSFRAAAGEARQQVCELLLIDEELAQQASARRADWSATQARTAALAAAGAAPQPVEERAAEPSVANNGLARWQATTPLPTGPNTLRGALDEPAAEARISTRCRVQGWALAATGTVEKVQLFLDGHFIGAARYGLARPDIACLFPQYELTDCGFAEQLLLDDKWADDAAHVLLIQITDDSGQTLEIVRSVSVHPDPYDVWIGHNEPDAAALAQQRRQAPLLAYRPLISIITPVYNPRPNVLRAMLDSVLAQTYDHWQLCLADGGSASPIVRAVLADYAARDPRICIKFLAQNLGISGNSNEALTMAAGEFVALLDHDDELTPNALYENVLLLNHHPDADMIYSDEDKLDEQGRRLGPPFCKPDWSPDLFRSMMYICHLGVYRTSLIKELGGFRPEFDGAQDYDLVLRLIERTTRIHHLPRVLYHWRIGAGSVAGDAEAKPYAYAAQVRSIAEHCQRLGWDCTVEAGLCRGHNRIKHNLRVAPRVSIIIPTRNRARTLRRCIESIRARSTYTNYEIIVVDNDSTEAATHDLLQALAQQTNMRVLAHAGVWNHSALINFAAAQAEGDLLLLLDNQVEVRAADWLEAMVGHAARADVGAVGAKLVAPDGSLQHGGFILRPERIALPMHQGLPAENFGYFGLSIVLRNVSAVTAACLMTRRALFQAVGGLNEDHLATIFNDVDYCLRLREQGLLILWTPFAELLYRDAVAAGRHDDAASHHEGRQRAVPYMQRRWHNVIEQDPYYSPNLTVESDDFSLARFSRYKPYAPQSR